jgi:galactose-1-phosphate uridylyltransferase
MGSRKPIERKVAKKGNTLVDRSGRIYIPEEGRSDTFTDFYGFNEYGYDGEHGKIFELQGDMLIWWKFGVDPCFLNHPLYERYLAGNEVITQNQMTVGNNPVMQEIHTRIEPWYRQYTTMISAERAKKDQKPIDSRPLDPSSSVFNPEKVGVVTPEPRIWHPDLSVDGYTPVTVPNKFSFMDNHTVTPFTASRKELGEFKDEDFRNYLEIARKNAMIYFSNGHKGMISIINFGDLAAASQDWPHSQEGSKPSKIVSLNEREMIAFQDMCRYVDDPDIFHMEAMRQHKLVISETEHAIAFAPFAPMLPDQVDIVIKDGAHNYLDLPQNYVNDIAHTMAKTVNALYKHRKVKDINIVCHQTGFFDEIGYRMHYHIYPRNKNKLGAMELDGVYIVDVFPETTAHILRSAA